DDDGAGAEVSEEADETAGAVKSEGATRLDEQCCPGQEADDGDEEGRSVAAEPNGDGDGPVEGGERQLIAQPRVEQPAQQHRQGREDHRPAVMQENRSSRAAHQQPSLPSGSEGCSEITCFRAVASNPVIPPPPRGLAPEKAPKRRAVGDFPRLKDEGSPTC